MKQMIIIILGICLIGLVSAIAVDLEVGVPYIIQLEEQFDYYSIIGNTTEIDLSVIQDANNNVTIIPNKYMKSDSFELIFFNREKEIINHYSSGGGGGTTTIYKNQTQTIEVPNYIDREVPGETITKTETEVVSKNSWWTWLFLCLTIVLIIIFIVGYIREKREVFEDNDNQT